MAVFSSWLVSLSIVLCTVIDNRQRKTSKKGGIRIWKIKKNGKKWKKTQHYDVVNDTWAIMVVVGIIDARLLKSINETLQITTWHKRVHVHSVRGGTQVP